MSVKSCDIFFFFFKSYCRRSESGIFPSWKSYMLRSDAWWTIGYSRCRIDSSADLSRIEAQPYTPTFRSVHFFFNLKTEVSITEGSMWSPLSKQGLFLVRIYIDAIFRKRCRARNPKHVRYVLDIDCFPNFNWKSNIQVTLVKNLDLPSRTALYLI